MSDRDTTVTDASVVPEAPSGSELLLVIHTKDKRQQGARHVLGGGPVRLGRKADNEIVLDEDAVSRRHARLERRGDARVVMDVGSRNGTLVNNREISGVTTLAHGDRLQIGSTIYKYLAGNDTESAFFEEIYQLMITDALTQVHNRRQFDEEIEREFSRARRFHRPFSVLLLDIDRFKDVNDTYGHLIGDSVLREVAQVVRRRVRRDDTVARYGGEEFVVLMPETPLQNARAVAETLRSEIAAQVIDHRDLRFSVTVSIGCAEYLEGDAAPADQIGRADESLYVAKRAGRNCVR